MSKEDDGRSAAGVRILSEDDLDEILTKELGPRAADIILIPIDGSSPAKLPFSWSDAKSYYTQFCRSGNDCDDGQFDSDCTHFMCHGLYKSSVTVNIPAATCASGLCVRVAELAAAFKNSVKKYSNVRRISALADTREGDYCFVVSWFGLSKDHAMALAGSITADGGNIYGHTANRCGEYVKLTGQDIVVYRIE
ncbi:hypothetical protein [Mesorhizobium sophorae]|uniref:hypothetical protein n=1 Tax=Mesorhizobium sophorae TaxID=1300294 RepID=UPI001181658B|nr:hypothetical protein [Mesorhizobium sophorae]